MSPSLVGRSTGVMYGTSPKWPNSRLVVKVSWVDDYRVSEQDFMDKAAEEATKPGHEWALNYLPRLFYVEDVNHLTDTPVRELFKVACLENKEYTYERRQMRFVVQEPLHPFKTPTNVKDVGQVMLDVACGTCHPHSRTPPTHTGLVYRWLYDHPGILHGDLSSSDIMYRIVEDKVHGVLTDYDLSSWRDTPAPECAKGPERATGTPPYMAQELLRGTSAIHLYRHDVESLFYVMLLMCGRHTIGNARGESNEAGPQVIMREGKLPYQGWFKGQDWALGCVKVTFILNMLAIELSPPFEDFRPWLRKLQLLFSEGFSLWSANLRRKQCPEMCAGGPIPFDDETLGGWIDYLTLIESTRNLTGELKGLIIRYDPRSTSDFD